MPLGRKPGSIEGGSGGVTLVVCASDATVSTGDFQCDGTADEVQINAAIAALGGAGVVQLSDGRFNIAAAITANVDGLILRGQGSGYLGSSDVAGVTPATELRRTAASTDPIIDVTDDTSLENLNLSLASSQSGSDPMIAANQSLRIKDCVINGFANGLTAQQGVVYDTVGANISGSMITAPDSAVFITDPYDVLIEGCYINNSVAGVPAIRIESTAGAPVTFSDSDAGVRIHNCWNDGSGGEVIQLTRINGAQIAGCSFLYNSDSTISIIESAGILVQGCQIGGNSNDAGAAIFVDDSIAVSILGNQINLCGNDGILLVDCDDCTVIGNSVYGAGQETDNTWAGIKLDGDTNRCNVQGNTVRYSGANHTAYGIRVDDATCDDNLVTNNDLLNSGDTANFSNAGTGTITAAANRV